MPIESILAITSIISWLAACACWYRFGFNSGRRDRLAGRETYSEGCGECFIAMHMWDGSVHAISGVAERISLEPSDLVLDTLDYLPLRNEWDVTIHFPNGFVEEIRPMDGRSVDG